MCVSPRSDNLTAGRIRAQQVNPGSVCCNQRHSLDSLGNGGFGPGLTRRTVAVCGLGRPKLFTHVDGFEALDFGSGQDFQGDGFGKVSGGID